VVPPGLALVPDFAARFGGDRGLITFYIAAAGWDGPVAADYYRKGLAINEELTRSALGRQLGVAAT
jgi:hypothetical protein